MKTIAFISILLLPITSFSQDTLDVEKRKWENLTEGLCLVGLSYTIPAAALILYSTNPYQIRNLQAVLTVSSALFISGVIWVTHGIIYLIKFYAAKIKKNKPIKI